MFALTPFRFDRGLSPAAHRKAIRDMDEIFDRLLWAPDLAGSRDLKDYDMYEKDGKLYLSIEAPGVDPDCMEVMIPRTGSLSGARDPMGRMRRRRMVKYGIAKSV